MKRMLIAAFLMVAASGAFASQQLEAKACAQYADLAGNYYKMKAIGANKAVVVNHINSMEVADRVKDSIRPAVDRLFATNMGPIAFVNWSTEYCLRKVIPEFRQRPLTEEEE